MITRCIAIAIAAFHFALAGLASASTCTERMSALEIRLNQAGEAASSASSGGQGVAAARESQAMQSRTEGKPVEAQSVPPFQPAGKEAQATKQAADAGGGGDLVMQARAKLNEARARDSSGDAAGCLDLIGQAERQLETR